jgi:molybdenum cofactor cytidylyltransferase
MSSIGAIILAAGGSSRFGQPKQLLKFREETLVRRAVAAALGAGCEKVVVVAGASDDAIREELQGTPAAVVRNSEWERGLGTSIRCGLQFLIASDRGLEAIVLLACDQPFVEAEVVAGLVAEAKRSGKPIVASSYANTLGVPAFFGGSCFTALLDLPDDSGAKSVIQSRIAQVASVPFEDGAVDIDTPEDFRRLAARSG